MYSFRLFPLFYIFFLLLIANSYENSTFAKKVKAIIIKMIYNPDQQYRCTIIRGKSISRMDDYLPIYAEVLQEICPISAEIFKQEFDNKLSKYIKDDSKTIRNHRTENVDKLLGLVYKKDEIIYLSARTIKYLENKDQPALFKSVCFQFQQPNGSQKINTIIDKIQNEISFKPYHFILALLQKAQEKNIVLTKLEIGYYVLNSLQVLRGQISVDEVFNKIITDRANNISKKVALSKNYAWDYQHINEQFDYLKLANLIREDGKKVWLNSKEKITIDYFIEDLKLPLAIDYTKYDLEENNIGKSVELEWQEYYGNASQIDQNKFDTSIYSLDIDTSILKGQQTSSKSMVELGDEGENFVLEFEKNLVKSFNPRLINKVHHLGKTRGLGYDIVSIEASRNPLNPEFFRYIEVKATTRVNPPNFNDSFDSINLTRNEWVAAEQHGSHFYIYRIYFTNFGTFINIINDPVKKNCDGILYATPTIYRVEFSDRVVDEQIKFE